MSDLPEGEAPVFYNDEAIRLKIAVLLPDQALEWLKGAVPNAQISAIEAPGLIEYAIDQTEQDENTIAPIINAMVRQMAVSGLDAEVPSSLHGFDMHEDGIALAFTNEHQNTLRYDAQRGKWYEWDGTSWRIDMTSRAFHWARLTCRQIAKNTNKTSLKAAMAKAATAAAVERFAKADPVFAVKSDIWDTDMYLLGTPGGTVDLRTAEMRPAAQEDYITKRTAVTPSLMPDCPQWLTFLDQVTQGDQDMIRFIKQWCGYCLTGDTREEALVFAFGPGGNGKSVFLNTVFYIMGEYATKATMDVFMASKNDKHSTDIAMLHGARLVAASETEEGKPWAEAKIKDLTGREPITARFMRQDNFTFIPQLKPTIVGNHKPTLKNVDEALRRRFNMLPFVYTPPKKDRYLAEKLRAEAPGILRWMIEGCLDWQMNGLIRPAAVKAATEEYFSEQDLVAQWVEEKCNQGPRESDTAAVLFKSWSDFARANGEEPNTTKWFSQRLSILGFQSVKNTPSQNGKRGFKGVSVKHEEVRDYSEPGYSGTPD